MNIEPNRLKHATPKPLKLKASKRPLEVLDVNDSRWLSLDIVVAPTQNGQYSVCIVPLFAHFSTVDLVKDDYFQWLRSQLTRPLWHEALQSLGLPTPKTHEFMNYQARLLRKHFPVPAPRVAETFVVVYRDSSSRGFGGSRGGVPLYAPRTVEFWLPPRQSRGIGRRSWRSI